MCSTCIYRPDVSDRLDQSRECVEADALAKDAYVVCHSTLEGLDYDYDTEQWKPRPDVFDGDQAVCAGYFERHGAGQMGRITERVGAFEFVAPPSAH
jgi:hypothetical protein